MEPQLISKLVYYYQNVAHTLRLSQRIETARFEARIDALEEACETQEERTAQADLRADEALSHLEKTKSALLQAKHELDALRSAHEEALGQDREQVNQARASADSFKREIKALQADIKQRDEELRELRQDAADRANEEQEAQTFARTRDRDLRLLREQNRAKDLELRKLNHGYESATAQVAGLEADVEEAREALKLTTTMLKEAEARVRLAGTHGAGRRSSQVTAALAAAAATQKALAQPIPALTPAAVVSKPAKKAVPAMPAAPAEDEEDAEAEQQETPSPVAQRIRKLPTRAAAPATLCEPPTTDYDAVPASTAFLKGKQAAARRVAAEDKENYEPRARMTAAVAAGGKKRKAKVTVEDFAASPPRLSSAEGTPVQQTKAAKQRKRTAAASGDRPMTAAAIAKAAAAGKTRKSEFSMTPFVDKTRKSLASAGPSLSPPVREMQEQRVRVKDAEEAGAGKLKKKRKLLGAGQRTLMDDTPKKVNAGNSKKVFDFGKDLSPLKRPTSSSGLTRRQ